jgi:hypothetical protein
MTENAAEMAVEAGKGRSIDEIGAGFVTFFADTWEQLL